jgi:hypothetical protein
MAPRPSEPLLQLLRETARKKGLNTAALAASAGIDRTRLKHVLAGSEALTVDELIGLSKTLELDAAAVAGAPGLDEADGELGEDDAQSEEGPAPAPVKMRALSRRDLDRSLHIDPLGNHAEQALRLGFGLGCDMFIHLHAARLKTSGIPRDTLARFPEEVPLRLDAAFHRHHDPRFLPEGLQVVLSFDALYTCLIPWDAFSRVTFIPLAPEPLSTDDEDGKDEDGKDEGGPSPEPDGGGPRRGHLRLV